ncbi:hypothetical protein pmac_cds_682 [Pandoravirus macleodensis]|uniref:Uncharacterized protein n=1 Tax=Pandoravirus macleodensis TaxID=2107707 RepID=A0A2U7UG90_9VIRU|nr:hypothetical protein pmac_cds_682 [Pandoravirus macleodensis]AVK77370.1 hypothetical protein pmac_cds_682 [Pandoravirus macleodensis]
MEGPEQEGCARKRSVVSGWWRVCRQRLRRRRYLSTTPSEDLGRHDAHDVFPCRRAVQDATSSGATLTAALMALGYAKVLLVEPGDVDALHPWHFYVNRRRPALLHLASGIYSTEATLDEDASTHLVVSGVTNEAQRFRVILNAGRDSVTAKLYRAPQNQSYAQPITCSVRIESASSS